MSETTIGTYAKAVSAAVVAGLTAAITALSDDGAITGYEWTVVAGAFLLALGAVWAVPNVPESVRRYGKAATSGLVAVAASVGMALLGDNTINTGEWLAVAVALLGGLGLTYAVPNAAHSDDMLGADGIRDDNPQRIA